MINETTTECTALPRGWKRREVVTVSGSNSARTEISYISPNGHVFNSRSQLERYLHGIWDISRFDFESGKMLGANAAVNGPILSRRSNPGHASSAANRSAPYRIPGGPFQGHGGTAADLAAALALSQHHLANGGLNRALGASPNLSSMFTNIGRQSNQNHSASNYATSAYSTAVRNAASAAVTHHRPTSSSSVVPHHRSNGTHVHHYASPAHHHQQLHQPSSHHNATSSAVAAASAAVAASSGLPSAAPSHTPAGSKLALAPRAAPTVNSNSTAPPPQTDSSLLPPIRQTASIFKQPVTLVHTTSRESRPAPPSELKQIAGSKAFKPKQVFWAKRLENVCAFAALPGGDTECEPDIAELPQKLAGVGPTSGSTVAMATLAKALQTPVAGHPITGQTGPKKSLESNPGVFVNPDQPLVQAAVVAENDVSAQERRVNDARRRLEEALRHFG